MGHIPVRNRKINYAVEETKDNQCLPKSIRLLSKQNSPQKLNYIIKFIRFFKEIQNLVQYFDKFLSVTKFLI
jgi:hypothetical protein